MVFRRFSSNPKRKRTVNTLIYFLLNNDLEKIRDESDQEISYTLDRRIDRISMKHNRGK